jgi:hypothetical protein
MELSTERVGQLIGQYRTHHPSRRDPRRCAGCGDRFQCYFRHQARAELMAAEIDPVLWA